MKTDRACVISDFHREIDENWAILGYYAASGGIVLPTFRDNISVPSSGVRNPKNSWPLKMEPIVCPETSVRNYRYSLRNNPEESSFQNERLSWLWNRLCCHDSWCAVFQGGQRTVQWTNSYLTALQTAKCLAGLHSTWLVAGPIPWLFASMDGLMTPTAIAKETERTLAPTSFKNETLLLLIEVVIC